MYSLSHFYYDHDSHDYFVLFQASGIVMMSPSDVVSVCNEDQLKIVCSTTENFLRWNVTLDQSKGLSIRTFTRTISSLSVSSYISPVRLIDSITIYFNRSSIEGELPLRSSLVISPVSNIINSTLLTCMELTSSNLSTAVVHVVEEGHCKCKLT